MNVHTKYNYLFGTLFVWFSQVLVVSGQKIFPL